MINNYLENNWDDLRLNHYQEACTKTHPAKVLFLITFFSHPLMVILQFKN